MEKTRIDDIDETYNETKVKWFQSENYKFIVEHAHILHRPIFTAKKAKEFITDLTYRKINSWDEQDLIYSSQGDRGKGWRKFSYVELVKLFIISDLRRIGLSTFKMLKILLNVRDSSAVIRDPKGNVFQTFKFLDLEYSIAACVNGSKVVLLIRDEEKPIFICEQDAILLYFASTSASSPVIILPFFSYVNTILKKNTKFQKDSTILGLYETMTRTMMPEKERKILGTIRNKKFLKIELVRSDNEKILITGTSHQRGGISNEDVIKAINEGQYQNVTVTLKGGKKTSIVREEKIKI